MKFEEQRLLFWTIFAGVSLVGTDVVLDVIEDGWNLHVFLETIVLSFMAFLFVRKVYQNFKLRNRLNEASQSLTETRAELNLWKHNNSAVLKDLEAAIEQQFDSWSYTQSEKEIATYLLKGMSARQIAEARNSAEKTVRQQCTSLYQKAGLNGRSELSAYFLEVLLSEPPTKT